MDFFEILIFIGVSLAVWFLSHWRYTFCDTTRKDRIDKQFFFTNGVDASSIRSHMNTYRDVYFGF